MARRQNEFRQTAAPTRRRDAGEQNNSMVGLVTLGGFLVFGLFILLPIFPPFGLVWCGLIGKALFDALKKQGIVKTDVENKADWKSSGQKAAKKFVSRMKAEEAMEKEFKSHPHTPMAYSYDSCAKEKRLEQIRTLKSAGLLTEAEYKQRRSSILAEK